MATKNSSLMVPLEEVPYVIKLDGSERLTNQVAIALQEALVPQGVGIILEAKHLCMMMRGVEKQNSHVVTSSMLGAFRNSLATREEFLKLIQKRN